MLTIIYLVLTVVNAHSIYRIVKAEAEWKTKFPELPRSFIIQNWAIKFFCAGMAAWTLAMAIRHVGD